VRLKGLEPLTYGSKADCSAVRRSFVECDKWLSGLELGIVDCTDSSLTIVHRLHDLARNTEDSVPDSVPGVESASCNEHRVRATWSADSLRGLSPNALASRSLGATGLPRPLRRRSAGSVLAAKVVEFLAVTDGRDLSCWTNEVKLAVSCDVLRREPQSNLPQKSFQVS